MKFSNKKGKKGGKNFWNREYQKGEHLALSINPSEDLLKFFRWLQRRNPELLPPKPFVLDLGCGNGRNLIYLAKEYGIKGIGYDISAEAIAQARKNSKDLPLEWKERSIAGSLDLPDQSVDMVLDMMASHFLNTEERMLLRDELVRIMKLGGWIFFKTFLLEEDLHAKRLLRENPSGEKGSYIHPQIGVQEHVWTIQEIEDFFSPYFDIHKIEKSHKHILHGKAHKRRSVTVYLERKWYKE